MSVSGRVDSVSFCFCFTHSVCDQESCRSGASVTKKLAAPRTRHRHGAYLGTYAFACLCARVPCVCHQASPKSRSQRDEELQPRSEYTSGSVCVRASVSQNLPGCVCVLWAYRVFAIKQRFGASVMKICDPLRSGPALAMDTVRVSVTVKVCVRVSASL